MYIHIYIYIHIQVMRHQENYEMSYSHWLLLYSRQWCNAVLSRTLLADRQWRRALCYRCIWGIAGLVSAILPAVYHSVSWSLAKPSDIFFASTRRPSCNYMPLMCAAYIWNNRKHPSHVPYWMAWISSWALLTALGCRIRELRTGARIMKH